MDAASEVAETAPLTAERARRGVRAPRHPTLRGGWSRWIDVAADTRRELLWITVIYLAARAAVVIAAVLLDAFGHHDLQTELANWDGLWYRDIANNGYPRHLAYPYHQNNLGFFPLFPVTIWLGEHVLELFTDHNQIWCSTFAGVFISAIGGWIATVFVHTLTEGWWDRPTARRATALFVVFPGAVVFSMVYSEALLLPLAAVCIWALERRRWVLAGTMAAFATAVQPAGLVLSVVCGVCALRELWLGGLSTRRLGAGLRSRDFRLSVLSTAMSGLGALGVIAFMWAWTGHPFAIYYAQHHGWSEKTDVLAMVHLVTREVPRFDPSHFDRPFSARVCAHEVRYCTQNSINLNDIAGFIGAFVIAYELWLLWRYRRELTLPAITWTLLIAVLALTSEYVPPNPRMLLTAFPMLVLFARRIRGQWFSTLLFANSVLLVGLGLLTFYERVLRP